MNCEHLFEKSSGVSCNGPYCRPDVIGAEFFAQNYSLAELIALFGLAENSLLEDLKSCENQSAYNQLRTALIFKGGSN